MSIIITLNGKTKEEIANDGGVFSEFSWKSLLPFVSQAVRLRDDELIEGIIVTEEALKVKIGRKRAARKDKGEKRKSV